MKEANLNGLYTIWFQTVWHYGKSKIMMTVKKEWGKRMTSKTKQSKNLPLSLTFNIQTVKHPQLNKGALAQHIRRQINSKHLYLKRQIWGTSRNGIWSSGPQTTAEEPLASDNAVTKRRQHSSNCLTVPVPMVTGDEVTDDVSQRIQDTIKVKVKVKVTQSCPTVCDPMD